MITLTGLHGQSINLNDRAITRVDSTTAEGVGAVIKMKDGGYVEVRERPSEVSMIISDLNGERLRAANSVKADAPIDMVLHCPNCSVQHIDAAEELVQHEMMTAPEFTPWDNPPHRSHLCHSCGHIWRPADVPTNGVAAITTRGKDDSPISTTFLDTDTGPHTSLGETANPIDTAPRDGTIVRLLVNFTEHPLEDDNTKPIWTIGGNSLDNTGEDKWQFAGWSWIHDCFTEGEGTVVGWLPLVSVS